MESSSLKVTRRVQRPVLEAVSLVVFRNPCKMRCDSVLLCHVLPPLHNTADQASPRFREVGKVGKVGKVLCPPLHRIAISTNCAQLDIRYRAGGSPKPRSKWWLGSHFL